MDSDDFDAVVVGAGHNGLVCAAYLARSGMRTLLVEARSSVGGTASSEPFGGGIANICNCDHILFRTTPVIEELGLADHGLRYLGVEPAQINMAWDGRPAWALYKDHERTLDELAQVYPGEVDGYRKYLAATMPAVKLVFAAASRVEGPAQPPQPRPQLQPQLRWRAPCPEAFAMPPLACWAAPWSVAPSAAQQQLASP
jgi:phytoene dehydrogenase-like protein